MRNRYLERYANIVKIKVSGKNIYYYIARILKKRIKIIKLIPISHKQVDIILKYSEYIKLKEIKSTYEVSILEYMGNLKIKEKLHKNAVLVFFLIIGIVILIFLSRICFSIEVIHQDREIRDLILKELNNRGVKKYHFKKSYQELLKIKEDILKNNKDKLEWLEIETIGTFYRVRVEERKIASRVEERGVQNIISRKDAVIVSIKAISGEKLKSVNDYVKKGDIIIAGYITLPNNTRVSTVALGEVLGEVWYTVDISYPFVYQETKLTGKSKTVLAFYFLDKRIGLFDFKEYKSFITKNKVLFSSMLLPIGFFKEKIYEMIVKDEVYTEDLVKSKAIIYLKEKLMSDNSFVKEISNVKILSSSIDDSSMKLKVFVKAIENIGIVSSSNLG